MPDSTTPRTGGLGRGWALVLLGVLMLAVLVGVLLVSGMTRCAGPADFGGPSYVLSDNRHGDAAAR